MFQILYYLEIKIMRWEIKVSSQCDSLPSLYTLEKLLLGIVQLENYCFYNLKGILNHAIQLIILAVRQFEGWVNWSSEKLRGLPNSTELKWPKRHSYPGLLIPGLLPFHCTTGTFVRTVISVEGRTPDLIRNNISHYLWNCFWEKKSDFQNHFNIVHHSK